MLYEHEQVNFNRRGCNALYKAFGKQSFPQNGSIQFDRRAESAVGPIMETDTLLPLQAVCNTDAAVEFVITVLVIVFYLWLQFNQSALQYWQPKEDTI